eukprot:TRINITY_DN19884_c0_g1_i3.p1 TRINITY_DN19884_c0_g1~~TRINITY_DN19884_c0_g1_i3.p1  ORF type:complete len:264 (+),score=57.28 TRINITY_DN19884_c0_g1_i3:220-1011(+)
MALITQMRNEIEMLRAQVVTQDDFCRYTAAENTRLKCELAKRDAELERLGGPLTAAAPEQETELHQAPSTKLEDVSASSKEFSALVAEVEASLREVHGVRAVVVKRIQKPASAQHLSSTFSARLAAMNDSSLNMRFFYGGRESERILCEGFSDKDMHDARGLNVYGRGLYFSPYFSKAHFFAENTGTVLLSLVGLGKSETVVAEDPKRHRPSKGHDSMCVPGRRLPLLSGNCGEKGDAMEDYVVFHPAQVLPMYLISYEVLEM